MSRILADFEESNRLVENSLVEDLYPTSASSMVSEVTFTGMACDGFELDEEYYRLGKKTLPQGLPEVVEEEKDEGANTKINKNQEESKAKSASPASTEEGKEDELLESDKFSSQDLLQDELLESDKF